MARGRPARSTVYSRLNGAIAELRERMGGLPTPSEAEQIWSDIWHLEVHHSTALEGNTLVLHEVRALLDRGAAVGAKPLADYLEVTGYADAATWVYAQAMAPGDWYAGKLVSLQEIILTHAKAMTPVWQIAPHSEASDREGPGQFRQHDIRSFGGAMTPPTWPLVPSRVTDWIQHVDAVASQLRASERSRPMPELLAMLHNEFECVHPFIDGNGRTGRLVLNLVLVRLGLPPVIVLKRQRGRYLDALAKADVGDVGPLGEILARAMCDNLVRFIVPNRAGPEQLVPLASLVSSAFTIAALRQAAQRGRLEAIQGSDGVWRSSARSVEEYRTKKGRHL